MLIPDSIEPYIGWKALQFDEHGFLHSPQQWFPWPPRERAEALCPIDTWGWVVRQGAAREETELPIFVPTIWATTNTTVTTIIPSPTLMEAPPPEPKPSIILPDGYHWAWDRTQHSAASDNNCSCGIYMVESPEQCASYLTEDAVFAQIAGWGNVIEGGYGARVQYAYPQLLVASPKNREKAEKIAEIYGVPLEIKSHTIPGTTGASALAAAGAMTNLAATNFKVQGQLNQAMLALSKVQLEDPEPPSAWIKGACFGIALVPILAVALTFAWGGRFQHTFAVSLCAVVFITVMLLLIDFLTFIQNEKAAKA